MSSEPSNHSNQAVSKGSNKEASRFNNVLQYSYERSQPTSQSTGGGNKVRSEDSQSRASKKAHKETSKMSSSKSNSRGSQVHSDLVKGKLASLMSSGSKYGDKRKKHSYSTGSFTDGGESLSKSSTPNTFPDVIIPTSKTGEDLLEEWNEHGLSSDEMRNKLFSSFKSKGILNGARIQIRADLASAINEKQILRTGRKSKVVSFASKISDCIVAEHLKKSEYEYSLSVFKAESLLSEFQFHPHEILHIMKLCPNSEVYRNLSSYLSQEKSKSFLWSFISEMVPGKIGTKASVECQTDYLPLTSRDIDIRMVEIEKDVLTKGRSGTVENYLSVEDRLFELQRKMEVQKKKEVNMEIQRLKDGLLREIRLEEEEKYNAKLVDNKAELDKLYKESFANLTEKERQMDIMMNQKKKHLEEEAYSQRQNLLDELKRIKEREADLQRQHDLAMKSVYLEEARLKSLGEELKVKEMSQKTLEERYEIRFQEEILKFKAEQQLEKQKFEEFYREQESKLNEEKALFHSEKASLMKYRNEFETLQHKNTQLQETLHSSHQKVYVMNQKIEDMKEKLQQTTDYPKLKEKALLKDREIEFLKRSLDEARNDKNSLNIQHRKDMKDLIDKFLKGTPETAKLEQQILSEREEFLEKEKELKLKCREVTKRLQEESLKNRELLHMYEECLLQNKALKREIGDLKRARNTVFQSQSSYSRSLRPFEYKMKHSIPVYQPPTSKKNEVAELHKEQGEIQTFGIDQAVPVPGVISPDQTVIADDKLASNERAQVSEDWTTFERLERESAALENMYHNFRASSIDRFTRESDFEKPNVNDFKPLQKYESTLKQDFSKVFQEASKNSMSEEALEKKYRKSTSASGVSGYPKEIGHVHYRDNARDYQEGNMFTNNMPQKDEVLLDNQNAHHLTEQLLKSAIGESDNGDRLRTFDTKSDVLNSRNSFDKTNAEVTKEIAKPSLGVVVNSDHVHLVKQGWEGAEAISPLGKIMDSENALENNARDFEKVMVTTEEGDKSAAKDYRNESTREQDEDEKRAKGLDNLEGFDGRSSGSKNDSQSFEERYKEKDVSVESKSYVVEANKTDYKDVENNSTKKEINEDKIVDKDGGADIFVKNGRNEDENQENFENAEDDHIDPLMKHYMEMVMKTKNIVEKESEKERLNLTDDTKIESKLSRSDISDLVEDKIEEIQTDSPDEFDW